MMTITIEEIEAVVQGGPQSPAMDKLTGKLKATKRPPRRLDEVPFRRALAGVLGKVLTTPEAGLYRAMGVEVPVEVIVKTVRKMERYSFGGAGHAGV
jgi:hypothetical protein